MGVIKERLLYLPPLVVRSKKIEGKGEKMFCAPLINRVKHANENTIQVETATNCVFRMPRGERARLTTTYLSGDTEVREEQLGRYAALLRLEESQHNMDVVEVVEIEVKEARGRPRPTRKTKGKKGKKCKLKKNACDKMLKRRLSQKYKEHLVEWYRRRGIFSYEHEIGKVKGNWKSTEPYLPIKSKEKVGVKQYRNHTGKICHDRVKNRPVVAVSGNGKMLVGYLPLNYELPNGWVLSSMENIRLMRNPKGQSEYDKRQLGKSKDWQWFYTKKEDNVVFTRNGYWCTGDYYIVREYERGRPTLRMDTFYRYSDTWIPLSQGLEFTHVVSEMSPPPCLQCKCLNSWLKNRNVLTSGNAYPIFKILKRLYWKEGKIPKELARFQNFWVVLEEECEEPVYWHSWKRGGYLSGIGQVFNPFDNSTTMITKTKNLGNKSTILTETIGKVGISRQRRDKGHDLYPHSVEMTIYPEKGTCGSFFLGGNRRNGVFIDRFGRKNNYSTEFYVRVPLQQCVNTDLELLENAAKEGTVKKIIQIQSSAGVEVLLWDCMKCVYITNLGLNRAWYYDGDYPIWAWRCSKEGGKEIKFKPEEEEPTVRKKKSGPDAVICSGGKKYHLYEKGKTEKEGVRIRRGGNEKRDRLEKMISETSSLQISKGKSVEQKNEKKHRKKNKAGSGAVSPTVTIVLTVLLFLLSLLLGPVKGEEPREQWFLRDKNGLAFNKVLFGRNVSRSMHGIWPDKICEGEPDPNLSIKEAMDLYRLGMLDSSPKHNYTCCELQKHEWKKHGWCNFNKTFWLKQMSLGIVALKNPSILTECASQCIFRNNTNHVQQATRLEYETTGCKEGYPYMFDEILVNSNCRNKNFKLEKNKWKQFVKHFLYVTDESQASVIEEIENRAILVKSDTLLEKIWKKIFSEAGGVLETLIGKQKPREDNPLVKLSNEELLEELEKIVKSVKDERFYEEFLELFPERDNRGFFSRWFVEAQEPETIQPYCKKHKKVGPYIYMDKCIPKGLPCGSEIMGPHLIKTSKEANWLHIGQHDFTEEFLAALYMLSLVGGEEVSGIIIVVYEFREYYWGGENVEKDIKSQTINITKCKKSSELVPSFVYADGWVLVKPTWWQSEAPILQAVEDVIAVLKLAISSVYESIKLLMHGDIVLLAIFLFELGRGNVFTALLWLMLVGSLVGTNASGVVSKYCGEDEYVNYTKNGKNELTFCWNRYSCGRYFVNGTMKILKPNVTGEKTCSTAGFRMLGKYKIESNNNTHYNVTFLRWLNLSTSNVPLTHCEHKCGYTVKIGPKTKEDAWTNGICGYGPWQVVSNSTTGWYNLTSCEIYKGLKVDGKRGDLKCLLNGTTVYMTIIETPKNKSILPCSPIKETSKNTGESWSSSVSWAPRVQRWFYKEKCPRWLTYITDSKWQYWYERAPINNLKNHQHLPVLVALTLFRAKISLFIYCLICLYVEYGEATPTEKLVGCTIYLADNTTNYYLYVLIIFYIYKKFGVEILEVITTIHMILSRNILLLVLAIIGSQVGGTKASELVAEGLEIVEEEYIPRTIYLTLALIMMMEIGKWFTKPVICNEIRLMILVCETAMVGAIDNVSHYIIYCSAIFYHWCLNSIWSLAHMREALGVEKCRFEGQLLNVTLFIRVVTMAVIWKISPRLILYIKMADVVTGLFMQFVYHLEQRRLKQTTFWLKYLYMMFEYYSLFKDGKLGVRNWLKAMACGEDGKISKRRMSIHILVLVIIILLSAYKVNETIMVLILLVYIWKVIKSAPWTDHKHCNMYCCDSKRPILLKHQIKDERLKRIWEAVWGIRDTPWNYEGYRIETFLGKQTLIGEEGRIVTNIGRGCSGMLYKGLPLVAIKNDMLLAGYIGKSPEELEREGWVLCGSGKSYTIDQCTKGDMPLFKKTMCFLGIQPTKIPARNWHDGLVLKKIRMGLKTGWAYGYKNGTSSVYHVVGEKNLIDTTDGVKCLTPSIINKNNDEVDYGIIEQREPKVGGVYHCYNPEATNAKGEPGSLVLLRKIEKGWKVILESGHQAVYSIKDLRGWSGLPIYDPVDGCPVGRIKRGYSDTKGTVLLESRGITISEGCNIEAEAREILGMVKSSFRKVVMATGSGKSTALPMAVYKNLKPYSKVLVLIPLRASVAGVYNYMKERHPHTPITCRTGEFKAGDMSLGGIIYSTYGMLCQYNDQQLKGYLKEFEVIFLDEYHVATPEQIAVMARLHSLDLNCKVVAMSATPSGMVSDKGRRHNIEKIGLKKYRENQNALEVCGLAVPWEVLEENTLIFCPSRDECEIISARINEKGYNSTYYYSGCSTESLMAFVKSTNYVVVATNAIESGITLPNLKNVIDTGIKYEKQAMISANPPYIQTTLNRSVCTIEEMGQRMGRVGRTSDGKYYHPGSVNIKNEKNIDYNLLQATQYGVTKGGRITEKFELMNADWGLYEQNDYTLSILKILEQIIQDPSDKEVSNFTKCDNPERVKYLYNRLQYQSPVVFPDTDGRVKNYNLSNYRVLRDGTYRAIYITEDDMASIRELSIEVEEDSTKLASDFREVYIEIDKYAELNAIEKALAGLLVGYAGYKFLSSKHVPYVDRVYSLKLVDIEDLTSELYLPSTVVVEGENQELNSDLLGDAIGKAKEVAGMAKGKVMEYMQSFGKKEEDIWKQMLRFIELHKTEIVENTAWGAHTAMYKEIENRCGKEIAFATMLIKYSTMYGRQLEEIGVKIAIDCVVGFMFNKPKYEGDQEAVKSGRRLIYGVLGSALATYCLTTYQLDPGAFKDLRILEKISPFLNGLLENSKLGSTEAIVNCATGLYRLYLAISEKHIVGLGTHGISACIDMTKLSTTGALCGLGLGLALVSLHVAIERAENKRLLLTRLHIKDFINQCSMEELDKMKTREIILMICGALSIAANPVKLIYPIIRWARGKTVSDTLVNMSGKNLYILVLAEIIEMMEVTDKNIMELSCNLLDVFFEKVKDITGMCWEVTAREIRRLIIPVPLVNCTSIREAKEATPPPNWFSAEVRCECGRQEWYDKDYNLLKRIGDNWCWNFSNPFFNRKSLINHPPPMAVKFFNTAGEEARPNVVYRDAILTVKYGNEIVKFEKTKLGYKILATKEYRMKNDILLKMLECVVGSIKVGNTVVWGTNFEDNVVERKLIVVTNNEAKFYKCERGNYVSTVPEVFQRTLSTAHIKEDKVIEWGEVNNGKNYCVLEPRYDMPCMITPKCKEALCDMSVVGEYKYVNGHDRKYNIFREETNVYCTHKEDPTNIESRIIDHPWDNLNEDYGLGDNETLEVNMDQEDNSSTHSSMPALEETDDEADDHGSHSSNVEERLLGNPVSGVVELNGNILCDNSRKCPNPQMYKDILSLDLKTMLGRIDEIKPGSEGEFLNIEDVILKGRILKNPLEINEGKYRVESGYVEAIEALKINRKLVENHVPYKKSVNVKPLERSMRNRLGKIYESDLNLKNSVVIGKIQGRVSKRTEFNVPNEEICNLMTRVGIKTNKLPVVRAHTNTSIFHNSIREKIDKKENPQDPNLHKDLMQIWQLYKPNTKYGEVGWDVLESGINRKGAPGILEKWKNIGELLENKGVVEDRINKMKSGILEDYYETAMAKNEKRDVEDDWVSGDYVEYKKPRVIQYPEAEVRLAVSKVMYNWIKQSPIVIPGYEGKTPIFELFEKLREEWDNVRDPVAVSFDTKAWDTQVTSRDLDFIASVEKTMYRKEYHKFIDTLTEKMKSPLVITTDGHCFIRNGQRGSGQPDTSSGNSLLNSLTMIRAFCIANNIPFNHFNSIAKIHVCGDDGLIITSKELGERFARLGPAILKSSGKPQKLLEGGELKLARGFEEIEFCSHKPVICNVGDKTYAFAGRSTSVILGKMGTKLSESKERSGPDYERQVAFSFLLLYPWNPLVRRICLIILTNLVGEGKNWSKIGPNLIQYVGDPIAAFSSVYGFDLREVKTVLNPITLSRMNHTMSALGIWSKNTTQKVLRICVEIGKGPVLADSLVERKTGLRYIPEEGYVNMMKTFTEVEVKKKRVKLRKKSEWKFEIKSKIERLVSNFF